jgi:hypothetical protein
LLQHHYSLQRAMFGQAQDRSGDVLDSTKRRCFCTAKLDRQTSARQEAIFIATDCRAHAAVKRQCGGACVSKRVPRSGGLTLQKLGGDPSADRAR